MPVRVIVLGVVGVLAVGATARAHLSLEFPLSRYGPDVLKVGPCGIDEGERTNNVTVFEPGETIEVRWREYVDHPGHYRIAFDADGADDFVDPATMMELYSNDAVLVDGIPDKGSGDADYAVEVTLPDVVCDQCTLQVTQVMYDKPPYTTPGNDIYYQCADLVLREGGDPVADAGIAPVSGGADPGGCGIARSSAHLPWWAMLVLVVLGRRLARVGELTV